jgi:BolA protein
MTEGVRPRPSAADLERVLREKLAPTHLEVLDDSHLHVGHAGAREGGHYTVIISSVQFAGLPPLARHRLVYDALREQLAQGIHALSIQARTS